MAYLISFLYIAGAVLGGLSAWRYLNGDPRAFGPAFVGAMIFLLVGGVADACHRSSAVVVPPPRVVAAPAPAPAPEPWPDPALGQRPVPPGSYVGQRDNSASLQRRSGYVCEGCEELQAQSTSRFEYVNDGRRYYGPD